MARARPPERRRRVLTGLLAALVVLAVPATFLLVRLAQLEQQHAAEGPFYVLPSDTPAGGPGDVVRVADLPGAPTGARAWRVAYHSTDERGDDVLVSGTVVAPAGAPPSGGRTVVSWGHPTTGAAPECAPSRQLDPFLLVEGLHELLDLGLLVVATDYPGMGIPGPSSYLIGATAGHAMLDLVRAARHIEGAAASDRVVLWGHSQGGHAALFAGQLAADYAPELEVLGVATAAPAAQLGVLLDDDIGDLSGVSIGAYAFTAYADFYGLDLGTILDRDAVAPAQRMARLCLDDPQLHELGRPLVGAFEAADPTTTPPWSDLLERNTPDPGAGPPLYVAQGEADELVRPASTADVVAAACAAGRPVVFERLPGVNHGFAAELALPSLLPWLRDLLDGGAPPTGC